MIDNHIVLRKASGLTDLGSATAADDDDDDDGRFLHTVLLRLNQKRVSNIRSIKPCMCNTSTRSQILNIENKNQGIRTTLERQRTRSFNLASVIHSSKSRVNGKRNFSLSLHIH